MQQWEAQINWTCREPSTPRIVLSSPASLYHAFEESMRYPKERFTVIVLDQKNAVIGFVHVTTGTLTCALAHPREVFQPAILMNGAGVILAHNHPSGDPSPGVADISVTKQLSDAGKILGIPVLDHMIFGSPDCDPAGLGYYSFADSGLI